MNAINLYRQGNLAAAIDAGAQELRAVPDHAGKRAFLAELLCIRGNYERAETQLETLLALEPRSLITVGTWRNLLQAATARQEVFYEGAVPDVISSISPRVQSLLQVLLALREGRDATELVARVEDERERAPCSINGAAVDDLRDVDDRFTGIVELLASNGKYFWVEQSDIVSLHFDKPERALDLLWRRAEIVLISGSIGQVFVPAVYPTPTNSEDAQLGKTTDWLEGHGVAVGIGQRMLLADDEAIALNEIETIEFQR